MCEFCPSSGGPCVVCQSWPAADDATPPPGKSFALRLPPEHDEPETEPETDPEGDLQPPAWLKMILYVFWAVATVVLFAAAFKLFLK